MELLDRRVEITGPVDRKMVVNALNSGAQVFMADFEDANSPTFENCVRGQLNLCDAVRRRIDFTDEKSGKAYRLVAKPAVLFARPRGWHLDEKHLRVDGRAVSASLFDFGLYFFHNARVLLARGSGPYFYLPKLESALEARLWNEVFELAQETLELPHGTIKATVLIETVLAAFEMDEILWELRAHSAGLNCGRWDYIFSFVKKFRADPAFVLPDRAAVGMDRPFLSAYSQLLVKTCHRRGTHAMGGMAAQIPIKDDPAANARALAKVRADKGARARERPRRCVGRASRARAGRGRGLRAHRRAEPARREARRRARGRGGAPGRATGDITETGLRQNLSVGVASRGLAARLGLRAAAPPDGGRGHGRDLAHAGLAVAAPRRAARRRARDRTRSSAQRWPRSWRSAARSSATNAGPGPVRARGPDLRGS